jgi:hypothetical protein
MKFFSAIAAACALACSTAHAARIEVDPPLIGAGLHSFYLVGESTTFNAIYFSVKPLHGAQFRDINSGLNAGVPRPPGQSFTYRNRLLDADPSEFPEAKGWTLLGVVNSTQEVAFTGGPLGSQIDTSGEPNGRLFLATVETPVGACIAWNVQLVNGIDTVATIYVEMCPEPAACAMAGVGALALVACRRKSLSRMRA